MRWLVFCINTESESVASAFHGFIHKVSFLKRIGLTTQQQRKNDELVENDEMLKVCNNSALELNQHTKTKIKSF